MARFGRTDIMKRIADGALGRLGILGLILLCVGAFLAGPAAALELVKRHKDWAVYKHVEGGKTVCFAISKPKDMEPKNVKRGSVYFYVTKWVGEPYGKEVSVKIGYTFKPGSRPTATIGADQFFMTPRKDRAFIMEDVMEVKMIDAMKRGNTMVITGRSTRGTLTTDKYSLAGITAALATLDKVCP